MNINNHYHIRSVECILMFFGGNPAEKRWANKLSGLSVSLIFNIIVVIVFTYERKQALYRKIQKIKEKK